MAGFGTDFFRAAGAAVLPAAKIGVDFVQQQQKNKAARASAQAAKTAADVKVLSEANAIFEGEKDFGKRYTLLKALTNTLPADDPLRKSIMSLADLDAIDTKVFTDYQKKIELSFMDETTNAAVAAGEDVNSKAIGHIDSMKNFLKSRGKLNQFTANQLFKASARAGKADPELRDIVVAGEGEGRDKALESQAGSLIKQIQDMDVKIENAKKDNGGGRFERMKELLISNLASVRGKNGQGRDAKAIQEESDRLRFGATDSLESILTGEDDAVPADTTAQVPQQEGELTAQVQADVQADQIEAGGVSETLTVKDVSKPFTAEDFKKNPNVDVVVEEGGGTADVEGIKMADLSMDLTPETTTQIGATVTDGTPLSEEALSEQRLGVHEKNISDLDKKIQKTINLKVPKSERKDKTAQIRELQKQRQAEEKLAKEERKFGKSLGKGTKKDIFIGNAAEKASKNIAEAKARGKDLAFPFGLNKVEADAITSAFGKDATPETILKFKKKELAEEFKQKKKITRFESANRRVDKEVGKISGIEDTNRTFEQLRALLIESRGGLKTGALEPFKVKVKAIAESFGFNIDVEKLGAQQAFDALTSTLALRLRNPDSGLGLTGNTSNRDLSFLRAAVMGLGKTNLSNELLLELAIVANTRRIDVIAETENFFEEKNTLVGLQAHLKEKFGDSQLMFNKTARKTINKAAGEAARVEYEQANNDKQLTALIRGDNLTIANNKLQARHRLTNEQLLEKLQQEGFSIKDYIAQRRERKARQVQ